MQIAFRHFETEICWVRITNFNQGQLSNTLICSWSSQKLEIDPAVCDKIQRTSGALIWICCQDDLTCQRSHKLWQKQNWRIYSLQFTHIVSQTPTEADYISKTDQTKPSACLETCNKCDLMSANNCFINKDLLSVF